MLAKNSLEGKAAGYLERHENIEKEIQSLLGKVKQECRELRGDQREICVEVKDAGIPVRSFKGFVKKRRLEKKIDEIPAGFDIDEAAAYNTLVDALGELGKAAAMAGAPKATDPAADDERDFRPTNLRNTDPDDLNKVGRGPQTQA
jgi:uncharacterized protein (UPF0335 family)